LSAFIAFYPFVMPGLVPGIHVGPKELSVCDSRADVNGRDKPGHDESKVRARVPI
jgi:hypothetical protein